MNKKILLGMWRHLVAIPSHIWRRQVHQSAEVGADALKFMSEDHHRVRNLVVRELPRYGRPIPPQWIAEQLKSAAGECNRHTGRVGTWHDLFISQFTG